MNAPFDASKLDSLKFGIGQPVPRREDPTLLRGEGRYTDDLRLPDQVHAVMVRSQVAHGVIKAIDTAAAKAMPGVLGVWTGDDLNAAGYGALKTLIPVPNRDGSAMKTPERRSLATGKVRFVGDPVAFVVAGTIEQAKDAAEAVVVDIDALPAVTDARAGAADGAPLLFDDAPGNICLDFHSGDEARVAAAFAAAAHVARLRLVSNRIVVCAMEPRSVVAVHDAATDRYTMHAGNQGAFGLKHQMAALLGIKPAQMRILTGNVGGSFGMKGSPYPEYAGLFHASKILGRPVKWTDDRSGSFLSDQHGRDHDFDGELALDKDGNFLAVRLTGFANVGGYLANVGPLMGSMGVTRNLAAVYRTPLIEVSTKVVFTNTSPVGAYRGAGRPEANYFMERLIDT
ncbi:MAG: xanthine dehydrogenase family protein molybdopterin-binding subunit, partial [Rhodospirillales bacterium]|nr:xanthine dehydrogenase family protein molybdopterin-binding subunit [Rhodospirillales bacterium]